VLKRELDKAELRRGNRDITGLLKLISFMKPNGTTVIDVRERR
jgi:hypothetical protein